MYLGTVMFFEESYNLVSTSTLECAEKTIAVNEKCTSVPTKKMVMNTMIFATYIFMNMFNQINCRVVEAGEANPFKTLFNNGIFWVVFGAEIAITHIMLFLGEDKVFRLIVGMTSLTWV
jgi:hypothetical protein